MTRSPNSFCLRSQHGSLWARQARLTQMRRLTLNPFPLFAPAVAAVGGVALLCRAADAPATNTAVLPAPAALLTTAEQVHQLSREEAALGLHAVIRGVVTCYLPNSEALVLQDVTRGIYVDQITATLGEGLVIGEILEVEGVTDPGQFAPQVHARRLKRLGQGELPPPPAPPGTSSSTAALTRSWWKSKGLSRKFAPARWCC